MDCSALCISIEEVRKYEEDKEQPKDERKVAFSVMGKAADKVDYPQAWIAALTDESREMAITALMEMSKTKCPQLVETYHWMWEKYQNDHIMCSHLKIAFETEGVKVQEK